MPRAPRIEFEGAVYHVMARGNRREPIVFNDSDRELFVETFGEACGRTGWEVFAWVLMENHYHLVFRTPQANLVSGMQWFQNAYTRRLNSRHRLWGHLFGGRYRSVLIENQDEGGKLWRDYLRTVIDYVHLNPGRAGIVDGAEKSILDYPWSSIAQAYARSPSKRAKWMVVGEGLDLLGCRDVAASRRELVARLDGWIRDERAGSELEGISFESRVKRGWYWGSEAFREKLLQRLEKEEKRTSRDYQSSAPMKEFDKRRAREIIQDALKHYGIDIAELTRKNPGDWKRSSVAWAISRETCVSQAWIAEHLNLCSAANSSQQIRRFTKVSNSALPKEIKIWKKSRNVA